jgi:hypothetical protein
VTNVAPLLQSGTNLIAARAINGSGSPSAAGFIARLDLTLANGLSSHIVSDSSWKATANPAAGWTTNGFDDGSWTSAAIIAIYDTGPWAGQTGGGTPVKRETNSIPVTSESAADLDGDLLPDWWERYYTGGTNVLLGGDTSHDADPAADVLEYRMGTNPTDSASYLRVALGAAPGVGYELTHLADPGRDYRLLVSEDLSIWSPADNWRYGDGQFLKYSLASLTGAISKAYLKVEVRPGSPGP